MITTTSNQVEDHARRVTEQVLELILRQGHPLIIVDAPPGSGKSTLVESLVTVGFRHLNLRIGVVAPRNEQTYDLTRRLISHYGPMSIQLLKAEDRQLPADLENNSSITRIVTHVRDLIPGPGIVIGTAAKFFASVLAFNPGEFDLLVCDEAYQIACKDFDPLFQLAPQTLLVGDPGQLPPLVRVDTARFEAARHRPHWPVPKEILRRFPEAPVIQLPASWRLRQGTVDIVQPSFYPSLPFVSAVDELDRVVRFSAAGMGGAIDRTLDLLADGVSIVGLVLPERDLSLGSVDEEMAALIADVASRLLGRGAEWKGKRRLIAEDIGCADPHVASEAAIRRHLQLRGISTDELKVVTPEIWQGLQRPIMLVKHPLSGGGRFTGFDLEPGRWCVMLSRHMLGCIVIAREGILKALELHSHNCADRPIGADDAEWKGWRAHYQMWSEIELRGHIVRV